MYRNLHHEHCFYTLNILFIHCLYAKSEFYCTICMDSRLGCYTCTTIYCRCSRCSILQFYHIMLSYYTIKSYLYYLKSGDFWKKNHKIWRKSKIDSVIDFFLLLKSSLDLTTPFLVKYIVIWIVFLVESCRWCLY